MSTMTPARQTLATGSGPACANVDPELMFPSVDSALAGHPNAEERAAQAVCGRCPVLAECRRKMLETPLPFGVAGGMTVADRRAARASRRGLTAQLTPVPEVGRDDVDAEPAPSEAPALAPAATGDDVDVVIAEVLAAHARAGHGADPVRVRELVLGKGPATASRWEVALASVVMLARGMRLAAISRVLGEDYTQLARWRERHGARQALVRGAPGAGTNQLARPGRLVVGLEDTARGAA